MKPKMAIWWINHLFNNYKDHARRRGYTHQADEIDEAQKMAVAALKALDPEEDEDEEDE